MSKTPSMSTARAHGGGSLAAARLELSEVDAREPAEVPARSAAIAEAAAPALAPVDDEMAPLSESSEEDFFFAHNGNKSDSLAPSVGDVDVDDAGADAPVRAVSAAVFDRRARLRKIVTGVVAGASVLAAFVLVKSMSLQHAQAAAPSVALNSLGPVVASIDMNAQPAAAIDQATLTQATAAPGAVPAATAEEQVAAEVRIEVFDDPPEPAQAPSKAGAAPQAAAPGARAVPPPGTKLEARRLLAAGKLKEAVSTARAALAADPTDAETYLLLGAALQDTGHWDESIIVFGSCVQNAKRGPVGDCRALSRR